MSNLAEYLSLVDEKLHKSVFFTDPQLMDYNVYVDRDFVGTLQQLYIVKNWSVLRNKIGDDELWLLLKLYEYRTSNKLVFDGSTGTLIADNNAQELYKKYYYNSLWLLDNNDKTQSGGGGVGPNADTLDTRNFLNIRTLIVVVILLVLFYYIVSVWRGQVNTTNNLLDILEESTRAAQQWPLN